jgi:hypothetical protein
MRRQGLKDRQLTNVGIRCRTARLTMIDSPKPPFLRNITATSESKTASLFINRSAELANVSAEIPLSLMDAATSFMDARTVKGGRLWSRGCINTSQDKEKPDHQSSTTFTASDIDWIAAQQTVSSCEWNKSIG